MSGKENRKEIKNNNIHNNETNTIANFLNIATQKLAAVSETPRLDAEILLSTAINLSREEIIINLNNSLLPEVLQKIESFLYQRLQGYSVAQVIQRKHFWKSEFIVTKDTFSPRPDTETLVTALLSSYQNRKKKLKIVEFGTGTGCLIISIINEYRNAIGYGFEKNFNTYLVTKKNINLHRLQNRIKVFYDDFKLSPKILNHTGTKTGTDVGTDVDIIISNPPYIKKFAIKDLQKEIQLEPKMALDGGFSGTLPYIDIFKIGKKILKKNGKIFLEIGDNQDREIMYIMREFPFKLINSFKDLSGKIRVLSLQMI